MITHRGSSLRRIYRSNETGFLYIYAVSDRFESRTDTTALTLTPSTADVTENGIVTPSEAVITADGVDAIAKDF